MDPTQWVEQHGDFLFRYAISRLRERSAAEDAVQETFLAALRAMHQYAGSGTERAWLLGILKRKIVDNVRARMKEAALPSSGEELEHALFDEAGAWKSDPRIPEKAVESREFWDAVGGCLDGLPPRQRDVFVLREMEEMKSADICSRLEISAANLWVLLHRARLRLARCMKATWLEAAS